MSNTATASCIMCGTVLPVERIRRHAKLCSNRCARARAQAARAAVSVTKGLSTGVVGAVAELTVAADLLRHGYEVFRAVSQACSCDLAVLIPGGVWRLEVRTGQRNKSGTVGWSRQPADAARSDGYAVVLHAEGEIIYQPALPAPQNSPRRAIEPSSGQEDP